MKHKNKFILFFIILLLIVWKWPAVFAQSWDFESGASGWLGGELNSYDPHGGESCLQIDDDSTTQSINAYTISSIPISHEKSYLFQAWTQSNEDGQQIQLSLNQYDEYDQWLSGNNQDFFHLPDENGQWSVFHQKIRTLSEGASAVRVFLRPVQWTPNWELTGTAWFDDVVFREIGWAWSFEYDYSGWTDGLLDSSTANNGEWSLRIEDSSTDDNICAFTTSAIAISEDKSYVLEVWARAYTENQDVFISVNQYDSNDQWIADSNMDYAVNLEHDLEWTLIRQTIHEFHAEANYIRIFLYPVRWTEGGELTGTAWFDDVQFEEICLEPTRVRGNWILDSGSVKVWQSPVEQKVLKDTTLGASEDLVTEVSISAARVEYESIQIVLLPEIDDSLTDVNISTLQGPNNVEINSSAWSTRQVAYIEITFPSDHGSMYGWKPDPLPELELPLSVSNNIQQPLWFTISVPSDTTAGVYTGTITMTFDNAGEISIPVSLRVWDFNIPQTRHVHTAYGLSLDEIDTYHNLGGDVDKRRQVFRLYLQDYDLHRVSPQDPFGDDNTLSFTYPNWNWDNGIIVEDPNGNTNNKVLYINDDDITRCIGVQCTQLISIDNTKDHVVSWCVKTDGTHDYQIAINQYDEQGDWIPGFNINVISFGSGLWQEDSALIEATDLTSQTTQVRLTIYAREWTSQGELTGITWYDDLSFSEQGSAENLLNNPNFDLPCSDVQVQTDFTEYDDAGTFAFETLHFSSFKLVMPYFAVGNFNSWWPVSLLNFDWGTEEYEDVFTNVLLAVTNHLQSFGWLNAAYTYWFDEPQTDDYFRVIEGMEILDRADPRLRRLLTEEYVSQLEGEVDIWTPILNAFGQNWAQTCQDNGEEVWWYVCSSPRYPYPNYFIDHSGIEPRIQFWMAWQYGLNGSLYWQTNYWTQDVVYTPPDYQDPWTDPMSYNSSGNELTNGDGRLLYPPQNWDNGEEHITGPVPSIRWELIREGLEDYEYFWLLKDTKTTCEQLGQATSLVEEANEILTIPSTILSSLDEYTDNPSLMENHRSSIASLLEDMLAYDLVNGIVGHWQMNENAASYNISDSSLNCNNGTSQRYTSSLHTNGICDGAFNLNDSSDYINCGYNTSFDFTTDLTISAWIKLDRLDTISPIVQKRDLGGGDPSFYFRVYANNRLVFCIYNGSSWIPVFGRTELTNGIWYHAVVTYNGQSICLYLNGQLDGSKSETSSIATSTHHLLIGKDGQNYFDGCIDDFRIYRSSLSQAQIYSLYSSAKYFDPIAWWPMNDSASNKTVRDLSGNDNDGTAPRNTELMTDGNGILNFNGITDYINCGDNSNFDFSTGLNISAWIKLDSLGRISPIVQKREAGSGAPSFYFRVYSNNKLAFCIYDGSQWSSAVLGSTELNQNVWYYVACSYDGQYLRVYLDGKLDGQKQSSGTIASGLQSLMIGKDGNHYFSGSLDNVILHDSALSTLTIRSIYVRETLAGLIGWWSMEDNASSTTVEDISGYQNDGTAHRNTNLLQFADSNRDGLLFNGSSDYVNCGNNSIFDTTEQLTISAWIKLASANIIQPIAQKREGGSSQPSFYFRVYSDNKMAFSFYNGTSWVRAVLGQTTLSQDTWYHTVVTYDKQNIQLYLNGQPDGARSETNSIATGSHLLIIGKDGSNYCDGYIDEVLCFNRALTADEVVTLFNE